MEEKMSDQGFNDAQNVYQRAAEARFPGYKGPVYGEYTPGKEVLELPRRTQVGFDDGTSYWLDVPARSLIGGDMIQIIERVGSHKVGNRKGFHRVTFVGMTMNPEYFDRKDAIPHKFGTFVELIRKARD
jgi:hypothetical protein